MEDKHPLVKLHLSQHYSDEESILMPDEIVKRYRTLNNEALYVIDCKHAQLELLTNNFNEVTGIDSKHFNELQPLYEHVSSGNITPFEDFTHKIVSAGFGNNTDIQFTQDDIISCIYKTHDDRVLLKSTCLLFRDSQQQMRYTLGKLMDVTGLVEYTKFNYKFTGPNSKQAYALFNELTDVNQLLSERELQILILIGKGMSSKEISNALFISHHTVRTHRKNILKKLEASASLKAYNKAKDMGLFQ